LLRCLFVFRLLRPAAGRPAVASQGSDLRRLHRLWSVTRPPRSGVSPLPRRTWAARKRPGWRGGRSHASGPCDRLPVGRPDLGSQTRVPAITGTKNQDTCADRGGQSGPVPGPQRRFIVADTNPSGDFTGGGRLPVAGVCSARGARPPWDRAPGAVAV